MLLRLAKAFRKFCDTQKKESLFLSNQNYKKIKCLGFDNNYGKSYLCKCRIKSIWITRMYTYVNATFF